MQTMLYLRASLEQNLGFFLWNLLLLFILFYLLFPWVAYRELRTGNSVEEVSPGEQTGKRLIRRQARVLLNWSIAAAGIAFLSIFPLLGIPGGYLLQVYDWTGISRNALDIDKAWSAAIYSSLMWPIALPAGIYLRQLWLRRRGNAHWQFHWVVPAVVLIWITIIGFIIRLAVGG